MNDSAAFEPVAPATADTIDQVFSDDHGLLAREFDGYKERPGQVKLARQIASAIDNGRHVIGEGPTGTGKSLAYAVPAIYATKDTDQCVVIVTANIALQEQLVNKDLPLLKKILPVDFSFALLKGIANYLCKDALEIESLKKGMFVDDDWKGIQSWALTTLTGDKSELSFEPGKHWLKVSSSTEECKRDRCPHAETCFGRTAQQEARDADVIVTNYHFLFAHYKIQQITGGMVSLLPEHRVLILDEAHKAADIAREFFGDSVSFFTVTKAAQKLSDKGTARDRGLHTLGVSKDDCGTLERATESFFERLTVFMRGRAYAKRLRIQDSIEWKGFCAAVSTFNTVALGATKPLRDRVAPLSEVPMNELSDYDKKLVSRAIDIERARTRLKEVATLVENAMLLEECEKQVYYLEEDRKKERAILKSKLIHPGPLLRSLMWEATPTVVATSATLSTAGSFDWISNELGAPRKTTDTIQVESPFDHKNALFVVPESEFIPHAKTEYSDFQIRLPHAIEEILHMSNGRALCLFTSYSNMKLAAEHLQRHSLPWTILVQGQAPRTKLVERFRSEKSSVLLGVDSFWAGVDVPGESLSCVIIDKIPFPTPADPVLDALDDVDGVNVFLDHMVPRAQVQTKQGVGRAIRSETDRAVIVVLDRRICEARYGAGFVSSLPPMLKTRDIKAVGEFLS